MREEQATEKLIKIITKYLEIDKENFEYVVNLATDLAVSRICCKFEAKFLSTMEKLTFR
mgnify:CR=1 FL=1